MKYNKILIVGGIGSGKTTLARKLTKILNIKNYELDNIAYKRRDVYEKYKPKERDKKLKSVLKRKKWIMEGFYDRSWVYTAYKKADIVVILNIKLSISKRRVITRFLKRKLSFKKSKKINKKFKLMLQLLRHIDKYPGKYFKKQREIVKKFKKEHVILKSNKEIKEFIKIIK